MAQLVEPRPAKQNASGSFPSQGTCLGCEFSAPSWGMYNGQPIDVSLSHQCFSPSFSPSLPLSLKKFKDLVLSLLGFKSTYQVQKC